MDGANSAPTGLRRQLRYALLFVAALLVPVSFRLVLWSESTVLVSAADLLGLYVDLCVTGVWVLMVVLVGSKSRWAAYALMVVWCLLNAANYEHVRALGTMPSLHHIYQLAEPAFLWGSAVVVSRPFLLAALVILIVAALRELQYDRRLDRQTAWFAALMLSMNLGLPLCGDFEQSAQWRQSHLLALNLSHLWNCRSLPAEPMGTTSHEVRHRVRRLVHSDLSGRSVVPPVDQPHNVLLLVLEGVSGAHIEPISRAQGLTYPSPMPRLSKLAAENLAWTQFVAQQRQTDRGLYSIMAGRYPQLNYAPSLMSNYVPDPNRPALPAVLREAGYETVFLQAANLDYMQKGRFMKSAGFDRVLGSESFQNCHFRTGWGPDDLTVMEKGYELIHGLNRQAKPWFLTVFTAGTHHPYEVPRDFQSGFQPGTFEHTAAYADAAVAELLSRLRQDGTLDQCSERRAIWIAKSATTGASWWPSPPAGRGSAWTSHSCKAIWPCRWSTTWAWPAEPIDSSGAASFGTMTSRDRFSARTSISAR
jgi:hypothetical protein